MMACLEQHPWLRQTRLPWCCLGQCCNLIWWKRRCQQLRHWQCILRWPHYPWLHQ
uniref:Uncharacterized protein n=1 Tax=Arundo donax TaxID=35708 RepID=A0A0A8Z8B8_ARUDO